MKKLFTALIVTIILSVGITYSPVANAHHNYSNNYKDSPFHPENPDYYNGNLRLKLKNRADIERASRPNLHYDRYTQETYGCNWKYNKGLETWVCNKDYVAQEARPVKVCPVGYTLNSAETACLQNYPTSQFAATPSEPVQQIEVTRYIHFYEDESPSPNQLPSTGGGMSLILLGSLVGAGVLIRKHNLN
ncbi:hypothetical protein KAR91_82110 [Candidatus Pacearchaeota archaeon]|nr:hypothetical protein [Candidatus Pacearchaeota archaeon]